MSLNPLDEAAYRYRLAKQHLARAERMLSFGDWASATQFAQLAVENFAKTLISIYEVPTWSHDPSPQLSRLIDRFPPEVRPLVAEIANLARELAPEHGRSTYGEPHLRLTPDEIYSRDDAESAVSMARRALENVKRILEVLGLRL